MFEQLIDTVQDAVKGEEIIIGSESYTTRPVFRLPKVNLATALRTTTLQSVVDYFDKKIDDINGSVFVHVAGPATVDIVKYLDEENRREIRICAEHTSHTIEFGRKYEQSEFITLLRSQVSPSVDRERLQKFVGSLNDESSLKLEDDGVSQRTVAKTGVATYSSVESDGVFLLSPFRTFSEIDQPESDFILRLHGRAGSVPLVSLHESDNHAWKLEAIERIAGWLKTNGVAVPILA
jgi:hypothetical protein